MRWETRSCERPRKRSDSKVLPSSVSNRYSLSTRTHGNSWRFCASSSPRRVCSFSSLSRLSRAASHSSRVPTLCCAAVESSFISFSPRVNRLRAQIPPPDVALATTSLLPNTLGTWRHYPASLFDGARGCLDHAGDGTRVGDVYEVAPLE